jgi:hypothetical protein
MGHDYIEKRLRKQAEMKDQSDDSSEDEFFNTKRATTTEMDRESTVEALFPDFTSIGHLLDLRLTTEEALEYVF